MHYTHCPSHKYRSTPGQRSSYNVRIAKPPKRRAATTPTHPKAHIDAPSYKIVPHHHRPCAATSRDAPLSPLQNSFLFFSSPSHILLCACFCLAARSEVSWQCFLEEACTSAVLPVCERQCCPWGSSVCLLDGRPSADRLFAGGFCLRYIGRDWRTFLLGHIGPEWRGVGVGDAWAAHWTKMM